MQRIQLSVVVVGRIEDNAERAERLPCLVTCLGAAAQDDVGVNFDSCSDAVDMFVVVLKGKFKVAERERFCCFCSVRAWPWPESRRKASNVVTLVRAHR